MSKIQALIVEDEKPAAQRLKSMLEKLPDKFEILAVVDTVRETLHWLNSNTPDLIFLDLQLSDGLGLDIFKQQEISVPVIFTTAYDKYAIQAFKYNSIDYLLKPFSQEDLEYAVRQFKKYRPTNRENVEAFLADYLGKKPSYKKRWMVHFASRIKTIKTEEIAFFEVLEKAVFLTTFDGNSYDLNYSLDKIETLVPPETFFRVNRKLIVNIDAIAEMHSMSKGRIKLKLDPEPQEEALVSFKRTSEFRKWISQ